MFGTFLKKAMARRGQPGSALGPRVGPVGRQYMPFGKGPKTGLSHDLISEAAGRAARRSPMIFPRLARR